MLLNHMVKSKDKRQNKTEKVWKGKVRNAKVDISFIIPISSPGRLAGRKAGVKKSRIEKRNFF